MIDETFIINLSHHIERKNDMMMKIKKTNIQKYTFFKAIDGEKDIMNYKFNIISNWIDPFNNRTITLGEIGCGLSHYALWKHIYDNKINRAFIMEDDVIFFDDFNIMYNKVQTIDFNYDLLYLSRNPLNQYFDCIGIEEDVNEYIVKPKSSYNTHSYIITYECAEKLLQCNFLDHLIPIDDFICIMYDDNYPFKKYSEIFKNFEQIIAYALKKNITTQNTHYYGSSIENSKMYEKNIKENHVSVINMSTWTIHLSNSYTKNEMDRFTEAINFFINYSCYINVNFFLNMENDTFCFIEKFIYDNILFHATQLNIDLSDKYISFWTKKEEYNFEHIHTHIDHCDYESNIYKTEKKAPLFTSLIYFDDNSSPTLVTDITRDMYKNKQFINIHNNKIVLSFPKVLKNLVFDSGKKYHGESYLADYEIGDRKSIVIAVWDKENKPLHIPYFDRTLYYYYLFNRYDRPIYENELHEFDKTNELITIKNRDNTIVTIPMHNSNLINNDFFCKLIITKEKNIMYQFFNLLKHIENPDTVVFDFSDIVKNPYENMNCYIEQFQIMLKHDVIKQQELIQEVMLLQNEYLFNINKEYFSMLEKYIYDISLFHMNTMNIQFNDIYITFQFANNNTMHVNKQPFMSCVTFLEDSIDPFYITDVDNESYKFKNFQNNKMFLTIPKKMMHIIFSGGNYYKHNDMMMLVIHFWKKTYSLSSQSINSELFPEQITPCIRCTKGAVKYMNDLSWDRAISNDILDADIKEDEIEKKCPIYSIQQCATSYRYENKDPILSFKKMKMLPKQLFIENENLFNEILYNKMRIQEILPQSNIDCNLYIVNIIKKDDNKKKNTSSNQIEKMKFCY